jgi:hypothetical protein
MRLRKSLLGADDATPVRGADEIDLGRAATIRYSSEDAGHPVEHMLDGTSGPGATHWSAAQADTTEEIVVAFDRPQAVSRLVYEVEERASPRTQEVRLAISEDGGRSWRQTLVQEYNFSPGGATYQHEDLRFERRPVTHLRLTIVPNKNGSGTATLTSLRLFV